MNIQPKGSELIGVQEAARLLNLTEPHAKKKLSDHGVLPFFRLGTAFYYDKQEFDSLLFSISTRMDCKSLRVKIYRTESEVKQLKRRLAQLEHLLGLNLGGLDMSDAGVTRTYHKIREIYSIYAEITPKRVINIARILLAMTEQYVNLMVEVTGDSDAWRMLIERTEAFSINVEEHSHVNRELELAHKYLLAGRRNLLAAVHCYCSKKFGFKSAPKMVPSVRAGDVDEEIMAIMLTHSKT
jgi:hypothetical protein